VTEAQTFEILTDADLRELVSDGPGPAISIYQPTLRGGPEADQNTVRLKNLIAQAEERLTARGLKRVEACNMLSSIRRLLDNSAFWRRQLDGLALFSRPDFFRYFKLPFAVDELVVVGDALYATPLVPAVSDGYFYILAISQASVRLFQATRFGAREVDISGIDIPRNLEDAMRYDDFEKPNLQRHPISSGRLQHGHGPGEADMKNEIARYFKAVDAGVSKLIPGNKYPLVIAAVDYLIPMYRAASSYGFVLEKGAEGNPDQLSAAELHERAWPVVEPHFRSGLARALERFGNAQGTGLASCSLGEVLAAAYTGRVDTLLVRRGEQRWGVFDLTSGDVRPASAPGIADVDLIDLATRQALAHGGDVRLVPADDMPCDEALAAVFRF
jgi:Bacterial archaeo-eukaryotic release factor family 3